MVDGNNHNDLAHCHVYLKIDTLLHLILFTKFQADGVNEKSGKYSIYHAEVCFPNQVISRKGKTGELQCLCLSKAGRYTVLLGRFKETAKTLRKVHHAMDHEWDQVTDESSQFETLLTGDLKNMSIMNGHQGASATSCCITCVRTRKHLGSRSWNAADMQILRKHEAFRGDSQLRHYPADPTCEHDVENQKCFCTDKCAEYVQDTLAEHHSDDLQSGFTAVDTAAPFHDVVTKIAREKTFATIAFPLFKNISACFRFPGIWHSLHNTRHVVWILIKDAAAVFAIIDALDTCMSGLDLPHIKVGAVVRPKKNGPGFSPCAIDAVIDQENALLREYKENEEARQECAKRVGMNGKELLSVVENFQYLATEMRLGVEDKNRERLADWLEVMEPAVTALRAGSAIALADMWSYNRAHEAGAYFRRFVDLIVDGIGPTCGSPYLGRDYISILPVHWLAEPDHFEAHASNLYEKYGVSPGSGSDATCEAVSFCLIRKSQSTVMNVSPPHDSHDNPDEYCDLNLGQVGAEEKQFLSPGSGSNVGGHQLSTTSLTGNKFWKRVIRRYGTQLLDPDEVPEYMKKRSTLVTTNHNTTQWNRTCKDCQKEFGSTHHGHSSKEKLCPLNPNPDVKYLGRYERKVREYQALGGIVIPELISLRTPSI
jgi:predicted house-cleaning noncanonical NTP pyrophosphatase (MazG superfamily)